MPGNQPARENKTDDLDLMKLIESFFSFARGYGRLVAFFSIGGLLAGFALYRFSPKQYESTMLLHSFMLSNTELINIIENWNGLLKDDEYTYLGKRLHCDPRMLKKVETITAAEIQKLYIPNNPNGFVVKALVKDNAVLDSLCEGIIYGLENNDYIKARLASRRSNLTALIDNVKIEIGKLDSTKKNVESSIAGRDQRPSLFIFDISTINGQVIGLQEKLLSYQEELKFARAVQVFHRFEIFEKPVSPKFLKSVALGCMGGFAIGYLFSCYLYLRKRFAMHARVAPGIPVL